MLMQQLSEGWERLEKMRSEKKAWTRSYGAFIVSLPKVELENTGKI